MLASSITCDSTRLLYPHTLDRYVAPFRACADTCLPPELCGCADCQEVRYVDD